MSVQAPAHASSSLTAAQRKCLETSRLEAYAKKARRMVIGKSPLPQRLLGPGQLFPESPAGYVPDEWKTIDVLKYVHPHARDTRMNTQRTGWGTNFQNPVSTA